MLGNHAPDYATASLSKIGPAFRKEGRVSAPDLGCASSGKTMTNKTHEHSTNENGSAESLLICNLQHSKIAVPPLQLTLRASRSLGSSHLCRDSRHAPFAEIA